VQRMLLDGRPTALAAWRLVFLPNEDFAIIGAGSENGTVFWVGPCDLPDGSCVPCEGVTCTGCLCRGWAIYHVKHFYSTI
jgi:hypothetical protein